jgi:hypothetical protein
MQQYDKPKKHSIGKLRRKAKTKEKSPDLAGKLTLQRHALDTITAQFADQDGDELQINLAGWVNVDGEGQYLTVEISPQYPQRSELPDRSLRFLFGDPEDSE